MIRQSLLARGKCLYSKTLHPLALHELSPSQRLLVQKLVLNLRRQDLCTEAADDGGDQHDDKEAKKDDGGEKNAAFRKKIEQLRELKRQKEELDRKYESYFTVDYALKFAQKGFQDSEDEDYVCSSDSEHSNLEVTGPSVDELSPDDFDKDNP